MKRDINDVNRPPINGQSYFNNQQPSNAANTAQINGDNFAHVVPAPGIAPMMVPMPGALPGGLPTAQLTQAPQWLPGGPGYAPVLPPIAAPQPAFTGMAAMPTPAQITTAAPPAPAGNATGGAATLFEDKALLARVKAEVRKGPLTWAGTSRSLKGEDRARFGIASLEYVRKERPPAFLLNTSMVHWCCKTIGLKRLLAEAWPDNRPFVSILVELGLNELLAEALKTEEGKASLQSATSQGATPLHAAARYHNVEAARLILGCDDEQDSLRMKPDKTEALAIHYAANAGADDIAGLLLARKGKEQRLAWGGKPACLPIHRVTAGSGNGALVRRLLKDCAVEQVTAQIGPSRATPLHLAVFYRSVELVRILLGVTAALPQQLTLPDSRGRRPIDIARANGDQEIIALLEAAMKDLPETASSSAASGTTTTTASTTTTTATTNDGPVPLTPYPATPFAPEAEDIEEAFEVSDPY